MGGLLRAPRGHGTQAMTKLRESPQLTASKAPGAWPGLQQELSTQQFLTGASLTVYRGAAPTKACCMLNSSCRPGSELRVSHV